jgi:hypothetical protein
MAGRPSLSILRRSISSADGGEAGKGMMGGELRLFGSVRLCLEAFLFIEAARICSSKASDIRAW